MKNERKQNIIEAALFPIIADLISTTVHVSEVWNTVKNTIKRSLNENKLMNIIHLIMGSFTGIPLQTSYLINSDIVHRIVVKRTLEAKKYGELPTALVILTKQI